tara:strand:+ start:863 stop:1573 length:711 start_codon:yes stop_codon:yes gene_type:complete
LVFDFNRIYIGSILLILIVTSYFFKLDYLILTLISLFAFYDLIKSKFIENNNELLISVLFLFVLYLVGIKYDYINYLNIIFLTLIIIIILKKKFIQKKLFTITVVLFLFNFYEIININRELFYFIIFVSFFNDTLAYIFGKLIKGPLIIPSISPKKTYSGTLISFLFTCILIYLFNYPLYLSILLSLSLFIGDIFFSFVKRMNNLKDFSNILKGHGGMLDRLDSMFLFVVIINYYL